MAHLLSRRALLALPLLPLLVGRPLSATAQDIRFLRLGTGRTSGAYFPVGGVIASAISNPPGSRPCDRGGSCGVPGLIAVAQSTMGSVDNLERLRAKGLDLAISQADVAYAAHSGTESFSEQAPFAGLRAIAALYKESMHLVVRRETGIAGVTDIVGKRISLGEMGSGTLVTVRQVLNAVGVTEEAVQARYEGPGSSSDLLAAGEIDGYFFFGGEPVAAVSDLMGRAEIDVVPIEGQKVEDMVNASPYLTLGLIPQRIYGNALPITTVQVGAVLVTRADEPDDLIEGITDALWHPTTQALFAKGPPQLRRTKPERALQGIAVPLHPAAATAYRRMGILKETETE